MHIEHEILKRSGESRTNRERFLDIANADSGSGTAKREGRKRLRFCADGVGGRQDAYMCEMPSSLREARSLETWKGPSRRPGRISWHWCRMSYLRLTNPPTHQPAPRFAPGLESTGGDLRTSTRRPPDPVSALGAPASWLRTLTLLACFAGVCHSVVLGTKTKDAWLCPRAQFEILWLDRSHLPYCAPVSFRRQPP